jgi:hypothetical protein
VCYPNWWEVTAGARLGFVVRDGDGSPLRGPHDWVAVGCVELDRDQCACVRQGILEGAEQNGAGCKTSGVLKVSSRVPDSRTERGSGAAHRPKRDDFRGM